MRFPLPRLCQFLAARDQRWCVTFLLVLLLGAFSQVMFAQRPVAALPQTYIDTTWNPPTGGTTWAVHSASALQPALNSASPGDIIVLDAGTTYTGNFYLIPKSNPNHQVDLHRKLRAQVTFRLRDTGLDDRCGQYAQDRHAQCGAALSGHRWFKLLPPGRTGDYECLYAGL